MILSKRRLRALGFEASDVHAQVPPTEVDHLSNIALKVYHGNHGSYLKVFADLWLRADKENKVMLRSVWEETIKKYGLDKEAEG